MAERKRGIRTWGSSTSRSSYWEGFCGAGSGDRGVGDFGFQYKSTLPMSASPDRGPERKTRGEGQENSRKAGKKARIGRNELSPAQRRAKMA